MDYPTLYLIGRKARGLCKRLRQYSASLVRRLPPWLTVFGNPWKRLKAKPILLLHRGYPALIALYIAWKLLLSGHDRQLLDPDFLTAVLFAALPVLLAPILRIGASSRKYLHANRQIMVPEPTVEWLRVSQLLKKMPDDWGAETKEKDDEFTFKTFIVRQWIVRSLKHVLDSKKDDQYIGLIIDVKDENMIWLDLRQDEKAGEHERLLQSGLYALQLIEWAARGHISLIGMNVQRVIVGGNFQSDLRLKDSGIGNLIFNTSKEDKLPIINVESSAIGYLHLRPNCCKSLILTDAKVVQLSCPAPERGNPFEKSLVLKGAVEFYTGTAELAKEQVQEYRNLRYCLFERRSVSEAYRIREWQMRAERAWEFWLVRFFSWLYDKTSSYGNAPHRALALMLLLLLWNFAMIWSNGQYVINIDCDGPEMNSWIATLCGASVFKGFIASFLLSFQPFIDPLGPFRESRMILTGSFGVSLWLWLSNVACLGLLATAWIGIRRSLKD